MEIKYRYYKDKVVEMHSKGYSPIQMEKEIPVESTTLKKWHVKLGLKINKFNSEINCLQTKIITKEEFIEVYNKGLDDLEIGNELKISRRHVCKLRKEYNLDKNKNKGRYNPTEELKLNYYGESALVGSLLGDGYLHKELGKNTRGTQCHSIKQLDYLKHLHEVFNNISGVNIEKQIRTVKGVQHEAVRFNFLCNPYLNPFHENLYDKDGKKIISDFILSKYNEISLAYHFMDDGTKGKSGYIICTYGFNIKCVEKLSNHLRKKFNLKTTIRQDKTIYIKSESVKHFNNLIGNYIISSMQYKLHK